MLFMFYTYVLYSKSTDSFYKGHTNDIGLRLKRHNGGFESFTSKGKPWVMIWFVEKETKSDAYQFEMKLKNLSRARLIKLMLKFEDNVGGPDELFLINNCLDTDNTLCSSAFKSLYHHSNKPLQFSEEVFYLQPKISSYH
jgi:putative endonuclease